MATKKYAVASHPNEGVVCKSNSRHYHTVDVATLNTWLANNIPKGAIINTVTYSLYCYYTRSFGWANIKLGLYYGTGENSGTNIGDKGNIPEDSLKYYSWDISSYFNKVYPFNMDTTQPKLVVCFTTSNITNPKVYCSGIQIEVDYTVPTYTITTAVSTEGVGTVTGGGTYESGSTVTLKATSSTGYQFVKWSDGNTSATRTITVTGNVTYTAIFRINRIFIGTPQPSKIYMDTKEVKEIYYGTTKVYG